MVSFIHTKKRHLRVILISAVLLLSIAGLAIFTHQKTVTGAVPQNIQAAVNFPIYYPNPQNLPAGYFLDQTSFRLAQKGVVIFAIKNAKQENIVFSEEQQPMSNDINKFISTYMPVNTLLDSPLGQARIGAYGSGHSLRTVISLPIARGPWLIISAPPGIGNNILKSLIQVLTD